MIPIPISIEFVSDKAPFAGHADHLVHHGDRRHHPFRFRFGNQGDGLGGAGSHAQAAADAPVQINFSYVIRIEANGAHLAPVQAGFASGAFIGINLSVMVGKDNLSRPGMLF